MKTSILEFLPMILFISAMAAGFAAMTAQLLLVRELMVAGHGDELAIGLVFFAWMLWMGIGSAAGGLLFGRIRNPAPVAGVLMLLLGALLPVSVLWARIQGRMFGYSPGEIIPVDQFLLMSMSALGPVCIVAGLLFPVFLNKAEERGAGAGGRAYAMDTLGSVAGGLVFSLALIPLMGPLAGALSAGLVPALIAPLWFQGRAARMLSWAVVVVTVLLSPIWLGSAAWRSRIMAWGPSFSFAVESPYSNITVLKENGQYSIFAGGRYSGTVPDEVFGEHMAHVPMLAHPAPRRALVVNGSSVAVREMLKHGLKEAAALELDPRMIGLKKKLAGGETHVFSDPGVRWIARDPRRFLSRTDEKFDVIILDPGPPDTLQSSRYYTKEFLEILRRRLAPDGIAAMVVQFTENYTGSDKLAELGGIIATFREADPGGTPLMVPGPKSFLIWKPGGRPDVSAASAARRFSDRKIESASFSADSAAYFFDRTRINFALSQFSDDPLKYSLAKDKAGMAFVWLMMQPGASVNTDNYPSCVYYRSRIGTKYYPSLIGKLIGKAAPVFYRGLAPNWVVAAAAVLLILGFIPGPGRKASVLAGAAAAGLLGMIVEIVLLMEFQIMYGVVYQYMGIITASFLGGGALGAAAAGRVIRKKTIAGKFALLSALALTAALPVLNAGWLNMSMSAADDLAGMWIAGWSGITGLCVGWIFPLAVKNFKGAGGGKAESSAAGFVYAADMLGACAGAVATAVIIIPLVGLEGALSAASSVSLCIVAAFAGAIWGQAENL